jgi:hypothetical protein
MSVTGFLLLNSEIETGLGKLLSTNNSKNICQILEILVNQGIKNILRIMDVNGNILQKVNVIWHKDISQTDMNEGIKQILTLFKMAVNVNMAVLSLWIKYGNNGESEYDKAVEIITDTLKATTAQKIKFWRLVISRNTNKDTNIWRKYTEIKPLFKSGNGIMQNDCIIRDKAIMSQTQTVIDITLWHRNEIQKYDEQKIIEFNPNGLFISRSKLKS